MSRKVHAFDFNEDYATDAIPVSAPFLLLFVIGTLIFLPVIVFVTLFKIAYDGFKSLHT
jgi:hypothetical protein